MAISRILASRHTRANDTLQFPLRAEIPNLSTETLRLLLDRLNLVTTGRRQELISRLLSATPESDTGEQLDSPHVTLHPDADSVLEDCRLSDSDGARPRAPDVQSRRHQRGVTHAGHCSKPLTTSGHTAAIVRRVGVRQRGTSRTDDGDCQCGTSRTEDGDRQRGTSQTPWESDGDRQCGTSQPTTRGDGDHQHSTLRGAIGRDGDRQRGTSWLATRGDRDNQHSTPPVAIGCEGDRQRST